MKNSQLEVESRVVVVRYRCKRRTHMKRPARACQSFTIDTVEGWIQLAPRARVLGHKRARTEILDDYSGILEIDHPGGQLMEWKARRWDWDNSAPRITGTVHIYRGLHAGLHVFSNRIMMSSQSMRLSRAMALGATPRTTFERLRLSYISTGGQDFGTFQYIDSADCRHYVNDGQNVGPQNPLQ
jgi:hypothetical protein